MTDVIPDGWVETTLGDIGDYLNGKAFKSSEWTDHGRPIIRIQDLTGTSDKPHYFAGEIEDRYVVRPGDLLVSWSATLGAYIWDRPEGVLNQHIFKVRSKIDRRLHYHLIRESLAELYESAHGSGMVHVTKELFNALPVLIPVDIDTQLALARILDAVELQQESVDRHLDVAQRKVCQLRQAILAAACSGRLTEDWQLKNPDTPTVEAALSKARASTRRRRNSEQPVDLNLPSLPDTYFVATLGEAAAMIEYGTSEKCGPPSEGAVAVLRMGNIQDGELVLTDLKYRQLDREIERLLLENGDLVFNRTNSPELVGKSAVFHLDEPMSFASYLIRVRFWPEVADPDFVNCWLNSAWGRAWANLAKTDGVSQSNINGSKVALMPLPLPPMEEQREIVRRVSDLLAVRDRVEERIESSIRTTERRTRSVLTKAFRGGILIAAGSG